MIISVVIPAYNEKHYLAATWDAIQAAAAALRFPSDIPVEIIVVDNNSRNATAAIGQSEGARVVHESAQGISRARNTGVRHAIGDLLVFIDADVIVPPATLEAIHSAIRDPGCVCGGVDVDYRPRRLSSRLYLRAWR